jgi:hypothetical protein
MDLCYEKKSKVLQKVLHEAARLKNEQFQVFHIPGCEAYGMSRMKFTA